MKRLFFLIITLCVFTLSKGGTIEAGEFYGSLTGLKSVTFSDITENEFKTVFHFKARFVDGNAMGPEDVTVKFIKIRTDFYGTHGMGDNDDNGAYLQIKDDMTIVSYVKDDKITDVCYILKSADKEKFKALNKEAKSLKGTHFSQGATSPVHQKYLNKIVFSKQTIELQKEQEANFVNEWNMSDELHLRVYLSKTAGNAFQEIKPDNNYTYNVDNGYIIYLDGQKISQFINGPSEVSYKRIRTWTTFRECASCNDESQQDKVYDALKEGIVKNGNKFTIGTHTLQIAYGVSTDGSSDNFSELAKGELKLNITKETLNKLYSNKSFWGVPDAKMTNKTYEQNILKTIQAYAKSQGWSESFTKISITSEFGTINNELTGAILGRQVEAACFAKWPDGHCTYQFFNFKQQYTGGGNYSPTWTYNGTGSQIQTPCFFAEPAPTK